ncbi:MAG: metallophosphoesterase family protein [Hyphomonas sp.]|nr:metallophosphoesterase family protein [Hyphomonas sp.]
MNPTIFCAIGDIHGELERLKDLHRQVLSHARKAFPKRPVQFIHLGDLIDRGPDSCGVVDYLMAFEAEMSPRPITLRGNHEQMMIDAHDSYDAESAAWQQWAHNGGDETLASYAGRPLAVLERHLAWLAALPTLYEEAEAGFVFVHAGIDPDRYPACGEQVHMWTRRREFLDPRCWTAPALQGQRVVHGHTPTRDSRPETAEGGQRLNIDTGAVYGGRLTAALLQPGKPDRFLHA